LVIGGFGLDPKTGRWDEKARLWDARTGQERLVLTGGWPGDRAGLVRAVAFSPDGTRLVVDAARGVRVYDAHTGRALPAPGSVGGTARVGDASTGQPLFGRKGVGGRVRGLVFSPDGTRLVTAAGSVRVWGAHTGQARGEFKGAGEAYVAFSPDGTRLATAGG